MKLIILEVKAHNAGHYTEELNNFSKYINEIFESVHILTPFGFKDKWKNINNCRVEAICNENEKKNSFFSYVFYKLYGYQWSFYKNASIYIKDLYSDENIIHIWDVTSIFPIWYFLKKIKNYKVFNLKQIYKDHERVFHLKSLGVIQGIISYKLLKNLADRYIVHTDGIYEEAISIGIKKEKLYKIGIGIENTKLKYDKSIARKYLNLPNSTFIMLFFGTIRFEKGIFELLEHIENISFNTDLILYIVGENKLHKSITDIIKQYKIKIPVLVHAKYVPESELELYFRASDVVIVCHQNQFKGESGVLLKAIQFQVPIIAELSGNSARVIVSEKIGATFNITVSGDLLQAIYFIKRNRKIINLNLLKARQKYSWENIIPAFEQVYSEVIKEEN